MDSNPRDIKHSAAPACNRQPGVQRWELPLPVVRPPKIFLLCRSTLCKNPSRCQKLHDNCERRVHPDYALCRPRPHAPLIESRRRATRW
jgi:hypothetical protein